MKSQAEVFREESARYWDSDEAARTRLDPRSSTSLPVALVERSKEMSRYHYFRFLDGQSDAHAVAGWCAVMEGRQRVIEETVRKAG